MKNIIAELEKRIAAELTPVDRESAFNEMLDDCYSFESVGGPFASMSPSSVLLECDPVAHRCAVNDYADGQDWTEVRFETYQNDDLERVKGEFIDELQSQLDGLQSELSELESEDDADESTIDAKRGEIEDLEGNISELESHNF